MKSKRKKKVSPEYCDYCIRIENWIPKLRFGLNHMSDHHSFPGPYRENLGFEIQGVFLTPIKISQQTISIHCIAEENIRFYLENREKYYDKQFKFISLLHMGSIGTYFLMQLSSQMIQLVMMGLACEKITHVTLGGEKLKYNKACIFNIAFDHRSYLEEEYGSLIPSL